MKSIFLLVIVLSSVLIQLAIAQQTFCNSDFDCKSSKDTLCDRNYCSNGVCAPTQRNVSTECCKNEDCGAESDICKQVTCSGGVFANGILVESPTCKVAHICCFTPTWDNYCNWPGEGAAWNRIACVGTKCDVLTWGAIYAFPLNNVPPNVELFQPRFYFRESWASLFKKFIIVSLNVLNNYGRNSSTEVPEIKPGLSEQLEAIETYLLSACDVWKKALSTCQPPANVAPSNYTTFDQFYTNPIYTVYNDYLSSIIAGKNISIPLCQSS